MRKLIATLLLVVPTTSFADYVDVLSARLKDGCSAATLAQIVKDFNATWAKDGVYKAELLVPMMSEDVGTLYWVGRTRNAETFGSGLERWVKESADPGSVAGKISARMQKCVTWGGRSGYSTH